MARPIVFVSDFGLGNEWVGLCHAVMSGISPESPIIDLSHLIRPLEVASGALLLADSMPYIPESAVVLAVVEPNVGKDREVAIETASGRILVGPDNGLLSLAWKAAGGVTAAVEITSDDVIRPTHAESFRAPDTFCPATAHLAAGMPIERLGTAVDPSALLTLELEDAESEPGRIHGSVVDVDRFGNIRLSARPADLERAGFRVGTMVEVATTATSIRARRIVAYSDVHPGEYGMLVDAWDWVSVIRYEASAAAGMGVTRGDPVWIALAG